MTDKKPTYAFDVDGHTVVERDEKRGVLAYTNMQAFQRDQDIAAKADTIIIDDAFERETERKTRMEFQSRTSQKERKATTPGWMSQALNEGDGVYRP
jgi:hypothetical protein